MKQIGLLSDTHGYLHPSIFEFFRDADEIWHAGDIGDLETANKLMDFKPLIAVFGNIDGYTVRSVYPEVQSFFCENVKVLMMHIGGYPRRYEKRARELILKEKPALFISGHSHILKVLYDEKFQLLHMNPGAAGKSGLHRFITLIRFTIDGSQITGLEVSENNR
ncbi:MAG: metallophosphoesterase family protein [Bacteroidales bacterium]|nr:metallophosphoesterase family protein [Bacteroidales bacterium]